MDDQSRPVVATTHKGILAARAVDAEDATLAAVRDRQMAAAVLNTVSLAKSQLGGGPWTARDVQVVRLIEVALGGLVPVAKPLPREDTLSTETQEPLDSEALINAAREAA